MEKRGAGAAAPNGFACVLAPNRLVEGVELKAKELVVVAGAPKPVIGLLNSPVPPGWLVTPNPPPMEPKVEVAGFAPGAALPKGEACGAAPNSPVVV